MDHLEAYKQALHRSGRHRADGRARHQVHVRHAETAGGAGLDLEDQGTSIPEVGITGIFSGGTEFTPQWTRYAVEELFGGPPEVSGVYMTPTYGNTLMGLACSKPVTAAEQYKISYYAPSRGPPPKSFRLTTMTRSSATARRAGSIDHVDPRVLRAGLYGARRGRARTALCSLSVGRGQRRAAFSRARICHNGGRLLVVQHHFHAHISPQRPRDGGRGSRGSGPLSRELAGVHTVPQATSRPNRRLVIFLMEDDTSVQASIVSSSSTCGWRSRSSCSSSIILSICSRIFSNSWFIRGHCFSSKKRPKSPGGRCWKFH